MSLSKAVKLAVRLYVCRTYYISPIPRGSSSVYWEGNVHLHKRYWNIRSLLFYWNKIITESLNLFQGFFVFSSRYKSSWLSSVFWEGTQVPVALPASQAVLAIWINLLATDFFFQILAHPEFKMWVIQKTNKVALWNKRHFEEKKMEIIQHV